MLFVIIIIRIIFFHVLCFGSQEHKKTNSGYSAGLGGLFSSLKGGETLAAAQHNPELNPPPHDQTRSSPGPS